MTNDATLKSDTSHMPPWSLADVLHRHAAEQPDHPACIFPETGRSLTYVQLLDEVRKFAGYLRGIGLKPGESVAYMVNNGFGSIISLLGSVYAGMRALPVNLVSGSEAIGYVLGHSKTRVVLVSERQKPLLEEARQAGNLGDLIEIPLDPDNGPEWPEDTCPVVCDGSDVVPDTLGLLLYTSGTTGRPKGVLHTHHSMMSGGWNAMQAHKLEPNDRAMCVLPLYHINGLCVTVMGPLVSGSAVILPHGFSASRFWSVAGQHEATWFSVVPTIISHLLHRPVEERPDAATVARLRFGRSASAPLSPEVQTEFEEKFGVPIVETMGLTETSAQILSNPLPPGVRKIGSPGKAYGNEVMIGDENQQPVPPNTSGEVLVRGPNVLKEYLDNPEATAEAFGRDGWFRTGDIGHMDEDGYFFITGRIKELIIKGGENVAPREIDEALLAHEDVIEAAAFAVACPTYGQTIQAAVMLRDSAKADEETLLDLCRKRLGKFKCPDCVHLLDELPKGPSGKIQRRLLAERFDV